MVSMVYSWSSSRPFGLCVSVLYDCCLILQRSKVNRAWKYSLSAEKTQCYIVLCLGRCLGANKTASVALLWFYGGLRRRSRRPSGFQKNKRLWLHIVFPLKVVVEISCIKIRLQIWRDSVKWDAVLAFNGVRPRQPLPGGAGLFCE